MKTEERRKRSRRLWAAALSCVVVSTLWAPTAFGTARVTIDANGALSIAVDQVAGADDDTKLRVEPIFTNGKSFKVGAIGVGNPLITSSDQDCFANNILPFNDVVCGPGNKQSITAVGGDGNDQLIFNEEGLVDAPFLGLITAPSAGCNPDRIEPAFPLTVDGGPGDDFLFIQTAFFTTILAGPCGAGSHHDPRLDLALTADGGPGADTLSGSLRNDTLRGGGERDELNGRAGRDILRGGPGPDVLDGGDGPADLVIYEGFTPVTVTIGAGADDGAQGEGDEVLTSVEQVTGGEGGDTLTGDADANTLTGNGGADTLTGSGGDDTLIGNADADDLFGGENADLLSGLDGDDELVGGPGRDQFFGGAGNDILNARDGVPEAFDCGPGTKDTAVVDLRDVPGGGSCETVDAFAVDDGPPSRALAQTLRVGRGGRVAVRLACPRRARTACRGVLTLRDPRSNRVLARGSYRLRLGENEAVEVTARRLPRRVIAATREQGVSKKGPRFSSVLLRVSR